MGNKPSGTYPNGVPYDKRRYNPHHPNHLAPPRNSPADGHPADAWMTRAPYATTWDFRRAQMQNRGPRVERVGMDHSRGIGSHVGSHVGSQAGSDAGAMEGTGPLDGVGATGSRSAAGSRRASMVGRLSPGEGMGGLGGAGMMPGPGSMPDPVLTAGSRQMGTGGFGATGRPTGPLASRLWGTNARVDPHTGRVFGRSGVDGLEFPLFPSPEVIRQREKERRKAWKAMKGRRRV
jgi:hypothetical protein